MSAVNSSNVGPSKKKPGAHGNRPFLDLTRLLAPIFVLSLCASLASAQSSDSILPGPKPSDATAEWKRLVGIYDYYSLKGRERNEIVFEKDHHLLLQSQNGPATPEEISEKNGIVWIADPGPGGRVYGYTENFSASGQVTSFSYLVEHFIRIDPGAESSHFFHIKLARPVDELRDHALKAAPPVEKQQFRKPDLVELAPLDPAIHLDIRYATANDFLGVPVYTQARAFLQRPAAEALLRALQKLKPLGYGLLIHDGYRPWYVTKIFWDATPAEGKIFVADPAQGSRHNRGCAVDLTLYDLKTGQPIEMTGGYDEMSPRSFPNYPGGTSLQRWHRDLLRRAMESEGFTVYEAEWWHFDYKDWREYGILNIQFEELGIGSNPK